MEELGIVVLDEGMEEIMIAGPLASCCRTTVSVFRA